MEVRIPRTILSSPEVGEYAKLHSAYWMALAWMEALWDRPGTTFETISDKFAATQRGALGFRIAREGVETASGPRGTNARRMSCPILASDQLAEFATRTCSPIFACQDPRRHGTI